LENAKRERMKEKEFWVTSSVPHYWNAFETSTIGCVRTVPRLCKFCSGICLTTEKKSRRNLSG
jgi:hypothetical protein